MKEDIHASNERKARELRAPCPVYDVYARSNAQGGYCSLNAYHEGCSGLREPSIAEAAQTVGAPGAGCTDSPTGTTRYHLL